MLWAQRTDLLYIRINVSDLKNDELNVTEEGLTFKGESSESQKRYEANLTFFKPVNPDMVRRDKTGRALRLVIPKKTDEAYWPRLLKDNVRLPFLKVDFEMWRDEDEEKEEEENLLSSMAAGAGGAGGLDFSQLAVSLPSSLSDVLTLTLCQGHERHGL